MKIGIVTHNFPTTHNERKDAGTFIYDFALELQKNHKEVSVFALNFEQKRVALTNISVTTFSTAGVRQKPGNWKLYSPSTVFAFFRLMRDAEKELGTFVVKKRIDFLLACWALPSGLLTHRIKKRHKVPYGIWTLGSDINRFARLPIIGGFIGSAVKDADILFANSRHLQSQIKTLHNRRSIFLPAATKFTHASKKIQRKRKWHQLLFVGRLEMVKGIDILVEAHQRLQERGLNVNLVIAGVGSQRKKLDSKTKKLQENGTVAFVGMLKKEEVRKRMLSSDLLVIPSRHESLPLVLIEAGKVGLPVIATRVGDCHRFIKTYGTGTTVQPEDADALAVTIRNALSQLARLSKRAEKAIERIRKDYNPNTSAKLFLKHVKKEAN